jgi:CDP-diacylglycerol---glycerol-3-phosphate 3-phosphatidyltransferase
LSRPDAGTAGVQGGAVAVHPPGLANIANALTLLRLTLVPVFVTFLLAGGPGWRIAAFVAFGIASVTDILDGELARRRSLITDFGKIADPIADKALTGSALVTLSALGQLPWWVTSVILFRELGVTGLRFWVIRRGVIAASRGGKVKTLLQVIAISLYVLPGPIAQARQAVMAAAVVVTVITGGDYVARAIRLHRAVPHHQLVHEPGDAGAAEPGDAMRPGDARAGEAEQAMRAAEAAEATDALTAVEVVGASGGAVTEPSGAAVAEGSRAAEAEASGPAEADAITAAEAEAAATKAAEAGEST